MFVVKLGKPARSVSIVGVGCTPFKNFIDDPELCHLSQQDLFSYAALSAMEDANIQPREVEYFIHGACFPAQVGGSITPNMQFADWLGMRGKGSFSHSEGCCTAYIGLELAVELIASGTHDVILTGACDVSSSMPDPNDHLKPDCFRVPWALADFQVALDYIYERAYVRAMDAGMGVIFDDFASVYAKEHGLSDKEMDKTLNMLSQIYRRQAKANPLGFYEDDFDDIAKKAGFENSLDWLSSPFNPKLTHYLRTTGFETKCDGAAALILMPTDMALARGLKPVEVLGTGSSCYDASQPHLERKATAEAARQVFELTGLTSEDMDVFYCNDFFLASSLCAGEEVGYLPKGEGWKYVQDGRIAYDGDKPMNTNGGRCSFGHAHGASGMADIYECVMQMRNAAPANQMPVPPKTALIRGYGGSQNVRCTILKAVN